MDIYVSTTGTDHNPGTRAEPVATARRALDLAREQRGDTNEVAEIWFETGTYYLDESLQLGTDDSGTDDAPMVLAALPDARVTISGGAPIDSKWEPWRDGIHRCRVAEGIEFVQLCVNGRRQIRARYPNFDPRERSTRGEAPGRRGEASGGPGKATDPKPGHCYPEKATPWPEQNVLHYDPQNFSQREWHHPEDGVLHVFPANYWGNLQFRLRGADRATSTLDLGEGGRQISDLVFGKAATGIDERSAFYVENIFEELDVPGEWYLDAREGWLYLMPEADMDLNECVVEASRLKTLISCVGSPDRPVRNLRFHNLRFTGSEVTYSEPYDVPSLGDWSIHRGGALFFEHAESCVVERCEFAEIGGNAVFVNGAAREIRIRDSVFRGIGDSAICFAGKSHLRRDLSHRCRFCGHEHRWGWDLPSSQIPDSCLVENNVIHDVGISGKQTAGVFVTLSRCITIRGNEIFNTPRAAICFNDGLHGGHLIEDNDIHDTVLETSDHGPINFWGRETNWCLEQSHGGASHEAGSVLDDAYETTVVRHNRFRDRSGWGIDIDDGGSNIHVTDNLCIGVSVKLREGDYRIVENNLFIDPANPPGAHVGYEGNHDIFRHNIVVVRSRATNREDDLDFRNATSEGAVVSVIRPPAKGRYFGEWDYNLYWSDLGEFRASVLSPSSAGATKASLLGFDEWRAKGHDEHSLFADPVFADIGAEDFSLADDSPAHRIGFTPFALSGFGGTPDVRYSTEVP